MNKGITIKTTPEEIAALVAAIQERQEGRMADIPTTKTDVLSARIAKAPPEETNGETKLDLRTSSDYKRPISERWAKGIEEAQILCPLQSVRHEYPKNDGRILLECKPSFERCLNCARASDVREGTPD